MTPSLPRATQIGSQQVVETLRKLAAEVGGLKAFKSGVREAIGNTNWTVLMQRLDEADAALSRTAQAPVADGVREAAQILLSEIDSATDMDCILAASSALRTALASSDPTPATEAGGDEVAAQRLAASPSQPVADAVVAQTYRWFTDGMQAAAEICGSLAETTYDDADGFEAATGCEAAIMKVVREQRAEQAALPSPAAQPAPMAEGGMTDGATTAPRAG